jgi:hypothetical protein
VRTLPIKTATVVRRSRGGEPPQVIPAKSGSGTEGSPLS